MYKNESFFTLNIKFCVNFDFIVQLKSRKVGFYDSIPFCQKLFAKALICFRFFLRI
jgi:hypothetical protein